MTNVEHARCKNFESGSCRSCSLLHVAPSERRRLKESALRTLVSEALGTAPEVHSLWVPESVFPSRIKCKMSVGGTTTHPVIGYPDRAGGVHSLLDCPLHPARVNALLQFFATEVISRCQLAPYDVAARRGELKHLLVVATHDYSQLMLRIVLRSEAGIPRLRGCLPELQRAFPELSVVSVNLQSLPAAIVEGPEEVVLTAQDAVVERYATCALVFAPQAFVQVTYETASELYSTARRITAELGVQRVLDLYCGVGGFLFSFAPHIEWGKGIELSPQAILCAQRGVHLNAATNVSFQACPVESFLGSYAAPLPDLVMVNPPRRGLGSAIVADLVRLAPEWILYSSCNPRSLVADLKLLADAYQAVEVYPFDMFPLTEHLEVLTLCRRIK